MRYAAFSGDMVGAVGFPGQPSNPVGFSNAAGFSALTAWPGGTTIADGTFAQSGSGTLADPWVFKFYDFLCGVTNNFLTITAANTKFIGCRFQSNNTTGGAIFPNAVNNIVFSYCSFVPYVSLVIQPPNGGGYSNWPSGGAGQNVNYTSGNHGTFMISGNNGYQYIFNNLNVPTTLDHCDIWGGANFIIAGNGSAASVSITNCWIHDARDPSTLGDHTDGVGYLNGGNACSNWTITGNTIATIGAQNSIGFQSALTPYSNINMTGNYLSGFGGLLDICHSTAGSTNITFKNNVIATDLQWQSGIGGDTSAIFTHVVNPSNTWSGNKLKVLSGTVNNAGALPAWDATKNGQFYLPNNTLSVNDWAG